MTYTRGFQRVSNQQLQKSYRGLATAQDIKEPKRATALSAGYDIYTPVDILLKPNQSIVIPTGLKAHMLDDEVLSILPRSGQGFKFFIRLANTHGVIDADYYNNADNEGHINVKIRNEGDKTFAIKKGEAFCQAIFQKYLLVDGDDFTGNERIGGTGSTSK